jgi:hypothetical protein
MGTLLEETVTSTTLDIHPHVMNAINPLAVVNIKPNQGYCHR